MTLNDLSKTNNSKIRHILPGLHGPITKSDILDMEITCSRPICDPRPQLSIHKLAVIFQKQYKQRCDYFRQPTANYI